MKQIVKLIQLLILSAISSYIGYGQTNTYLAPVSVPPGYEQFNNNHGIRAIWGAPAFSESRDVVKFSNTISNGESLYFDISNTGNVYFIGLSGSPSETNIYSELQGNPNIIFGMSVGLNNTAQAYEGGISTGPTTTLTSGNTLKISYSGSTILYQKSTDGINFTTFHTSNNVANGVYTVYFEAPPQGAGPDNLYKNGTAVIPSYAYVYKVKADSVKITNDNCNAELIIENSTKHIQGFLYNYGNGRTQFRKILQKLNDSMYIIGNDTLRLIGLSSGSTSITATNGLTKVGNDIQLGGVLTSRTTIGGGTPYSVTFQDSLFSDKDVFKKYTTTPGLFRIGSGAFNADSTSVYVGFRSGDSATVDNAQNTFVGYNAGKRVSTGKFNVFYGHRSGESITTGNDNTGFGWGAMFKMNSGIQHTAIGYGASNSMIAGNGSTAVGYAAFNTAKYSNYDVAIGNYATRVHQNVSENVSVGYRSLYGAVGALSDADTLRNNVALGAYTGYLNLFGDGNIFIGHSAGYNETGSNKLYIENSASTTPLIHGDFAADSLRFNGKISVRDVDSVNTPQNMLYVTQEGRVMKAAVPSGGTGTAWSLTGNTGTNSANNFIGTTDNQKLVFRTKNIEQVMIDTLGNVGIGVTNPQYKLDVNGTAKINSMPFLANRDTVLTYDPVTKQIKVTKVAGAIPTTSSVYILNQLTATATTSSPATGLSFPVTAGIFYKFKFVLVFRTAATTTGIKLGLNTPGFTVFSANVDIPIAADGAAGLFSGWLTTSGDVVTGTGVQTANTDYTAIIEGIISPSANGTIQLIFGSEITGSQVTLRPGCIINIEPYGLN